MNSRVDSTNRRTSPKRRDSQPVSGRAMALLTAKEVMTQVPWFGLTARSPEIAGSETLAIDVSSTCMKVPRLRPRVSRTRVGPCNGG